LNNLNLHIPTSLYALSLPEAAQRLLRRIEFHHTPKHGSWLNIAELEFRVLSRQCLDRRNADRATLSSKVVTWEVARNATATPVDWRFTTRDARIKLKRLYPVIHN